MPRLVWTSTLRLSSALRGVSSTPSKFSAASVTTVAPVTSSSTRHYSSISRSNRNDGDKLLYTPGPLTTSKTVKEAMQRDFGSRDVAFQQVIAEIRSNLLKVGGVDESQYTTIPMQGAGTMGLESVVTSVVPQGTTLLVCENGAYGRRILDICKVHDIKTKHLSFPENTPVDPEVVSKALGDNKDIQTVLCVHCETTTGILNPIKDVGSAIKSIGRDVSFICDAMSSFGGIPIDISDCQIDYLVSSSNKCIEGVPGFSFIVAKKGTLEKTTTKPRVFSLDLKAQVEGLDATSQFRFTPPTHSFLAFHQALRELEEEGGVSGRYERYKNNQELTIAEFQKIGFKLYLEEAVRGPIITTFLYPEDPNFNFETFYKELSDLGFVIYPGKLTTDPCFRIGHIGRVFYEDTQQLIDATKKVLGKMGIAIPVK